MNYLRTSFCCLALALGYAGTTGPALAASMPSCASGDPVVWENTSSKVYHESGDKYYGNTKSGSYACKSDADKAGFHLSKSKTKGGSSAASGGSATAPDTSASGAPAPGASPTGKHHRHSKSAMSSASAAPGAMGSAAPGAMASPAGKHHRHKKGASASPAPAAT